MLWLNDGTTIAVTDPPEDYIRLDKRLAEIRARLSLKAAPPTVPLVTASAEGPSPALKWPVILAASHRPARGLGAVCMIFTGIFVYGGTVAALSSPGLTTTGRAGLISLFLVIGLPMFAMGFFTLFGRTPRLRLDPTTRHAHFEWSWPSIWPNETVAFADMTAAGVWEGVATRDGHTLVPYIELATGRIITLTHFSEDFRAAQNIARRICIVTWAELRNKHVVQQWAAKRHSTPENATDGSD